MSVVADYQAQYVTKVMKRIAEQCKRTGEYPPDKLSYRYDKIEYDAKEKFFPANIVMLMMVMMFHEYSIQI